jgi:hypothetical protein
MAGRIAKPKPLKFTMQPVKSAAITDVGYHPETQTLRLVFTSGHVGHYADVSPEKHAEMLAAESIGKYFHQHIRANHDHTRVS